MHQMGFAQAGTAIDEQRVVDLTDIVRHRDRRRPRQLVGLAFDEALEGEGLVQKIGLVLFLGRTLTQSRRFDGRRFLRADLEMHRQRRIRKFVDRVFDDRKKVLLDVVDDETVGGEQLQLAVGLHRLQRPDPGTEIRARDFVFQFGQAVVPNHTHRHSRRGLSRALHHTTARGRA